MMIFYLVVSRCIWINTSYVFYNGWNEGMLYIMDV